MNARAHCTHCGRLMNLLDIEALVEYTQALSTMTTQLFTLKRTGTQFCSSECQREHNERPALETLRQR